jgi:RNA:NAD 2'-phosphotransferase (TPT1/KptA family)
MSNTKKTFNRNQRNSQTLYRNKYDLDKALSIVTENLKNTQDGIIDNLPTDEDGFCKISDVVSMLRGEEGFDYVNNTHIVELFFKDPDRKVLINGEDRIKYKSVRYVKPPSILYFGTLENLKDRMVESGLRSRTKGYIKLYDTPDKAILFASKFATEPTDKIVTLTVDADKAFSEGLKFSTYVDGEYIVVQVDKKYLNNSEGNSDENY